MFGLGLPTWFRRREREPDRVQVSSDPGAGQTEQESEEHRTKESARTCAEEGAVHAAKHQRTQDLVNEDSKTTNQRGYDVDDKAQRRRHSRQRNAMGTADGEAQRERIFDEIANKYGEEVDVVSQDLAELPRGVWKIIFDMCFPNDQFSFAMTCREFRELQKEVKPKDPHREKTIIQLRKLRGTRMFGGYLRDTRLKLSAEWIRWAHEAMGQESYARIEHRRYLIFLASLNGHLEELKWLVEEGCSLAEWDTFIYPSRSVCDFAALGGHLNVLEWLRDQGCHCGMETCAAAAEGGHLEVLQWLRARGCTWCDLTCRNATMGGHLKVLQWAVEQGCDWIKGPTCTNAALAGHLKVLQWARKQGCPWNEYTCEEAASGGHLKVLQWARGQGCPWNKEECLRVANECGRDNVVAWIEKQ